MLKQFKRLNESEISLSWTDGHSGSVSLSLLRDACPCAGCKGETVLLHTYRPVESIDKPGKYDLKGADIVGNYALQLQWGDGHREGIYTWEHLRSLCQCSECVGLRKLSDPR